MKPCDLLKSWGFVSQGEVLYENASVLYVHWERRMVIQVYRDLYVAELRGAYDDFKVSRFSAEELHDLKLAYLETSMQDAVDVLKRAEEDYRTFHYNAVKDAGNT